MQLERKSYSPQDTIHLAKQIGTLLQPGDVLTLDGELGAGKTHFTKGIASALGIKEMVNSPTFTIMKEYEGRLPLYHMDVYRLEEEEAEEIGLEEYLEGDGVSVIEWADKITSLLPPEKLEITLGRETDTTRVIQLHGVGDRFIGLLKELEKHEDVSD
ncbi:tRNA threonylcarbamoyladenosine biosynthesis protein TsaE [Alteribacillus persepolensis]|uniref:tRNA threonylcarbamoyladenosine biosynthesis protein TsaE n=1 Tax=Alteribacillus persepolensis TaxID=568899 RepID=A0A1G8J5V1_9BACI|nr:tRNA (adenosine(37)-N6)-threonylcarbamoyltransferase complex ATPase subunit type 1 TsaE [Alteribacillus persepolensis]SDI26462.1 tRNA threonylcarbamoyladenosine biosynthesis protein TsaE [Alteribacillus persepolensis]